MKHYIWNYIYFLVAIPFLTRFLDFSSSGNPSYLITGSMGIIMILLIFSSYKYLKKIFPLILMGLIIFSGLILVYTYLFRPIYTSSNEYYYAIGTFLIYMVYFAYGHIRRWDLDALDTKHD